MIEHPGLLHVGVPHVSAEGGSETAVTGECAKIFRSTYMAVIERRG